MLAVCAMPVLLAACGGGSGGAGATHPAPNSKVSMADGQGDLANSNSKEIAMQLVSTAENSTRKWRTQYGYIEDIGDDRGYTGGIIGFTSGTGDMLELVRAYTAKAPGNPLAGFLPALQAVNGTASHDGLGDPFVAAWKDAAKSAEFTASQDSERDRVYFDPAVSLGKADGLGALGQFIYYDAAVVHGRGNGPSTLDAIRATAMAQAATPAQGGNEVAYLNAFLDARVVVMKSEPAHKDVSRIETAQRVFLQQGNLGLNPPLNWAVYGTPYSIPDTGDGLWNVAANWSRRNYCASKAVPLWNDVLGWGWFAQQSPKA